ncbi:hypothetical protein [Actinophytocola gossypii]|uniref:Uncharacterized protein n=1 Tax=Actinophytocola gossypii TaxID=2812003 RepID=A0ABT2JJN7_9PSEU|nr:hypothetical protein [Actinophytocola gossypii]MCT2588103.1 hypothetical protein [Actinophytocola gossypii]
MRAARASDPRCGPPPVVARSEWVRASALAERGVTEPVDDEGTVPVLVPAFEVPPGAWETAARSAHVPEPRCADRRARPRCVPAICCALRW